MRLHLLYEAVLLSAAAHIFAVYAPPIAAYFMVGMAMLILGVEILDGFGVLPSISDVAKRSQ
jgi:hypothetical protein